MHLLAGYAIHPILLANLVLWPWAVLYMDRALFIGLQVVLTLLILVAPLSFLLASRERGDPLSAGSLVRILAGVCLGVGLMIANTVGQVQGILSRTGEFRRTPKRRRSPAAHELSALGADRPYPNPLHWTFFLELIVVAYCALGLGVLVVRGELLWTLPLAFWGMCLALVVLLQWAGVFRREPSPTLP